MVSKSLRLISLIFLLILSHNCSLLDIDEEGKSRSNHKSTASIYEKYNRLDSVLQSQVLIEGIDWQLIKAIIIKESHFDPHFISTAGAVGLMQLMPRKGSYTSSNYEGFMNARKRRRNKNGKRIYQGKTDAEWAGRYRSELDSLLTKYRDEPERLYQYELRFNLTDNIKSGVRQISSDYSYFRKRNHGKYKSRILALAAYNAGRGAVVREKSNPYNDHIPINRQTELYVGYVEKIYAALLAQDGKITESNAWVLSL